MLYRERGFEEIVERAACLVNYGFSPRRTKTIFTRYARNLMILKGTGSLTPKELTEHDRSARAKATSDHCDMRKSVFPYRNSSKKRARDNHWELHKSILQHKKSIKVKARNNRRRYARAYCHMEI